MMVLDLSDCYQVPYYLPTTVKIKSDVTSNLTIHRVKLSTAAIGTYNLKIERKGYDDYDTRCRADTS